MPRYNLLTSFRVVLSVEAQNTRAAAFTEISKTNPLVGTVYWLYSRLPWIWLKALAVFLFGLKCALEIRYPVSNKVDIIATGLFPNEVRTIERIQRLAPDLTIRRPTISVNPITLISQMPTLAPLAQNAGRLFYLCRLLVRRYDFMPACRGYSVIIYFLAFLNHLKKTRPRAALIVSNYAPDAMGLAAAASRLDVGLLYANHAFVPPGAKYLPPVYADLSILTNELCADLYRTRSQLRGQVVFLGVLGETQPLRLERLRSPRTDFTVGIFLTGGTDKQQLRKMIQDLRCVFGGCSILVRPHPVHFFRHAVSDLNDPGSRVKVTSDTTITEDARACDLVICGNTSGVLEVLKAGTPVLYCSGLDRLPYDDCGFVRYGLIPDMAGFAAALPEDVAGFYARDEWRVVMTTYDPSLLVGSEAVVRQVRTAIDSLLASSTLAAGS